MRRVIIPREYTRMFMREPGVVFQNKKTFWIGWRNPLGEKCLLQINLNSSATAKSIITEMYAGGADMSDFGSAGITYKQRLNNFLRDYGSEWSR